LNEGELLNANQYLRSLSGSTYLLLRDNGDLELYSYGRMLWTSARRQMSVNGTIHQGPFKLMIDPTGNIAVKNGLEMDAWSSNTWLDPMKSGSINGPYQLVVREKQAALINRSGAVLWDTQTAV
jgi:hypothetical protein